MSIGPLGYPDYQRNTNWDSIESVFDCIGPVTTDVYSNVINCSQYGYTFFRSYLTGVPVALNLKWYLDSGMVYQVARRQIMLDPALLTTFQCSFTNLGAYCQISLTAQTAGQQFNPGCHTILMNRAALVSQFPITEVLCLGTPALAGGAVDTISSVNYFAGGASYRVYGGSQGVQVDCQYFNPIWDYLDFFSITAPASTAVSGTLVWPPSATQVNITNTSPAVENDNSDILFLSQLG